MQVHPLDVARPELQVQAAAQLHHDHPNSTVVIRRYGPLSLGHALQSSLVCCMELVGIDLIDTPPQLRAVSRKT
jgi:hypothetical protein